MVVSHVVRERNKCLNIECAMKISSQLSLILILRSVRYEMNRAERE